MSCFKISSVVILVFAVFCLAGVNGYDDIYFPDRFTAMQRAQKKANKNIADTKGEKENHRLNKGLVFDHKYNVRPAPLASLDFTQNDDPTIYNPEDSHAVRVAKQYNPNQLKGDFVFDDESRDRNTHGSADTSSKTTAAPVRTTTTTVRPIPTRGPTTTRQPTRPTRPTTTVNPAECERNCNLRTTPQYNPVCGSDGTTYYSENRLKCAQRCGKGVSMQRMGACSTSGS